jgi:hypothetical protein
MPLALIALAVALGDLALAPAVVNGDGLGYLKAAAVPGVLVPGHLAYLPLLRALRALVGAVRPVDALGAARVLSAAAAGLAVLSLGAAARRLNGGRARAATVAALGLGASNGLMAAGSDVETYAPALAAVCVTVYALARRRTGGVVWCWAAAAAIAAAALLHVENALLLLPATAALEARGDRARLLVGAGALIGGAYAAALAVHPPGWLGGATHGFHYPITAATPAVALYGACKALVFSPYPYEAPWTHVLALFAIGAAAAAALAWTVAAREPATARLPLGRAATAAWLVPYAAVGGAFFASDAERWVFLLPLGWLTVATARRRAGAALAIAALVAAVNVAVTLPRARDDGWRVRAAAASRQARAGDLVVSPGHGWDELIGFYDGPAVEPFPLVYYAGATGGRAALAATLGARAATTRARGGRVLLVRLDDGSDPMGWKELRPFGVTPSDVAGLLPAGTRVALGDGVEELRAAP